jgi:TRAP-type mannitol/chloroaromatic compound transport system permease large subunit
MSKSRKRKNNRRQPVRWPVWLAIGGGLIVLAAVLIGLNSGREESVPQVTGAPALAVDQKVFDYGQVKLGSVVTTRVQVTNVGDQPLRFTEKPYVELVEGC